MPVECIYFFAFTSKAKLALYCFAVHAYTYIVKIFCEHDECDTYYCTVCIYKCLEAFTLIVIP